jgi:hypothetical protein
MPSCVYNNVADPDPRSHNPDLRIQIKERPINYGSDSTCPFMSSMKFFCQMGSKSLKAIEYLTSFLYYI